jgi:hypothetical protein
MQAACDFFVTDSFFDQFLHRFIALNQLLSCLLLAHYPIRALITYSQSSYFWPLCYTNGRKALSMPMPTALQRLCKIAYEMKPIRDLNGLGSTLTRSASIFSTAITTDHLHFWVLA